MPLLAGLKPEGAKPLCRPHGRVELEGCRLCRRVRGDVMLARRTVCTPKSRSALSTDRASEGGKAPLPASRPSGIQETGPPLTSNRFPDT